MTDNTAPKRAMRKRLRRLFFGECRVPGCENRPIGETLRFGLCAHHLNEQITQEIEREARLEREARIEEGVEAIMRAHERIKHGS